MKTTTFTQNEIIYQTKIHWISYVKPLFFIILGLPFLISLPFVQKGLYIILCAVMGFVALKGIYIYWYLKRLRVILSKRFLSLKTGVFINQISDIVLSKAEGITVQQSLLGRLLNYGALLITTGEVTQSYFIQKPMEFRDYLLQSMNQ